MYLDFMIKYYRRLQNKDINEEHLLASNDNVIRFLMKSITTVNNSGDINTIKNYLLPQDHGLFQIYINTINRNDQRRYNSETYTYAYISELIRHYEEILLT